ncbi:MAG: hypothetical protein CSA66_02455 [Proteobacteria bacterium]|nr:MAG: hypothetical protein CSA66_02455 [Pseudomonadota bacterium]
MTPTKTPTKTPSAALGVALALLTGCAAVAPAAHAAAGDSPSEICVVFETEGGDVPVWAEVAATPARRQIGYMYRLYVPPGTGMVFPMPDERVQSFWMRNTLVPLDMLFVDRELKVVGIVHRATPLTLESRSVPKKSVVVIELQGGWANSAGVAPGDKVRYEPVQR